MCLTRALISMHMGTHSGEGSPVLPIPCGTPKALPLPTATAPHPADTWAPWHHLGSGTARSRGRNMLHLRSHSAGHSRVRKSPSCSLWAEGDPESVFAPTATRPGAPPRISGCPGGPGLYPCPVGPLQGTVPGVCSNGCWNSGSLEHPRAGMVKSAQQAWQMENPLPMVVPATTMQPGSRDLHQKHPQEAAALTKFAGWPRASGGTETVASGGVTGGSALATASLQTALPEGARSTF